MKLQTAILKVFFVVVIVGVAVGNEEGGAESGTPHSGDCNLSDNVRASIFVKVFRGVQECFHDLNINTTTLSRVNIPSTDIQHICDETCRHRSTYAECLKEKASKLEVCSNPVILKLFNIYRDLALKTFQSGCANGAQRMFTMMMWINLHKAKSPVVDQFHKCGLKTAPVARAVDKSEVEISSKLFIFYKNIIEFVECTNEVNDHQPSKEVVEYFTNEVLKTMKCIHPQEETLVPCASIDVGQLSASNVCEVKAVNSTLGTDEILENEAGRCFDNIMTADARQPDFTSDNEAFREYITYICNESGVSEFCLNDTAMISEICLNKTQKFEFNLYVDSIRRGYDAACREDGKHLADILYEVYRLKRTGQGHAVWDCVDVAKSTRNEMDEHRSSSKNMQLYHELEAFKECLVVKLGGNPTSVAAATSLIDETLARMRCVSVTDGPPVLCTSLMHNHH